MTNLKKIAVINDLSGFGKCSLCVALPIISAHKIQCCPLTTGVFSNQTGYDSFKSVDFTDYMQGFIDEWKKLDASFDGILTGFIPNSNQGKIISSFIDEFKGDNTVVIVDPVMGDNGEVYPCYDDKTIEAIKSLAKKADVVTPNLTELSLLCGAEYSENIDDVEMLSKSLGKTVITTGIPIGENEIANAVYENGEFNIVKSKRFGGSFSGTGDILASIIASKIVSGSSALEAVKKATTFIEKAVAKTIENNPNCYTPDGIDFEEFLADLI